MVGVRLELRRSGTLPLSVAVWAVLAGAGALAQQAALGPTGAGNLPAGGESVAGPSAAPSQSDLVVDVRIVGNKGVSLHKIAPHIKTRAQRGFDRQMIEEDVRRLNRTRLFVNVDVKYQRVAEGIVVIFEVVERPTLNYVKYLGATIKQHHLDKQTNLKPGDAVDPYLIEEGRRKLVEYYHSKGFAKAQVTVLEGDRPGDRGAVYLINEGVKQKIWDVKFVGNTIASGARLKTQIQSKPPILLLFKGEIDWQKIDEDVNRLTAYYRSLGFFRARIGRYLDFNEEQDWATLTFVIDEGPRYRVRSVSVIGNQKFGSEQLLAALRLKDGQFFDQSAMNKDVSAITDAYGGEGYIFCSVQADPRFLEEPGELDLVYQIEEGKRYRVGRIDVKINGEDARTRRNVVLNRVSLRPGDVVDTRELRASERRLRASGLFLVDPAKGIQPKIVFQEPKDDELEREYAQRPAGGYRGQSPDDEAAVVLVIDGNWQGDAAAVQGPSWLPAPLRSLVPDWGRHHEADTSVVRGQSPAPGWPHAGQVPLGRTDPYSSTSVQYTYGGTGAAAQATVPAQYTPPGQYSAGPTPPAGQVPYVSNGQYGQPSTGYGAPAPWPNYPAAPLGGAAGATAPPPTVPNGAAGPQAGGSVSSGQIFGAPPWTGGRPATGGYANQLELTGEQGSPYLQDNLPLVPPDPEIPLTVDVSEAQTGRFMVGVGVNSNAGVVGSIVLDEQNFDWRRWPQSGRDIIDGRAWRGGGQQFRIEAVPGSQVSRYMFTFREPYLLDTPVSLGLSGFYFNRFYRDWTEERLGGRIALGYQFTPDLSGSVALRMENVNISDPTVPTPAELAKVLGDNGLYTARFNLVHDTRDSTFMATEGHRIELAFEQAFGDFDFPRGTIEAQQHFMIRERPDGSGRQVLSLTTQVGFSGSQTPVFENFFAGGFSTLRGFRFRGASPRELGVIVGGEFQWLNTIEYNFPISADDMLRAVVFCDFGTVEEKIELNSRNYRVAPGAGLRITIPAMGPAPIALDFAVPVAHAPGDDNQIFSFFVGFGK